MHFPWFFIPLTVLAQDHFYSIPRHLQDTFAKLVIHDDVGSVAGMDVVFFSIGVRRDDCHHATEAEWMMQTNKIELLVIFSSQ